MAEKEAAIIEASALLVTLIFVILSFYGSELVQYYSVVQRVGSSPLPEWLTRFSSFVSTLERFSYATGFVLVAAALVATLRLFMRGPSWFLTGLEYVEGMFFAVGLALLAVMFFLNASADPYWQMFLAVVTACCVPLLYAAYSNRRKVENSAHV